MTLQKVNPQDVIAYQERLARKASRASNLAQEPRFTPAGPNVTRAEPAPACQACGDLGFIVPVDPETGRSGRAVPCRCQLAMTQSRVWTNSGLVGPERDWGLDYVARDPGKRWGVQAVRQTLQEGFGWVVLYGDYGMGKSGLLKAAVAKSIREGSRAYYRRGEDVLAEIRETFGDDPGDYRPGKYEEVPVLALDEVDRISMTSWAQATIFRLLDHRYNRRDHCITLLATNAAVDQMSPEWGYLQSRMGDGLVVAMAGSSLRGGL